MADKKICFNIKLAKHYQLANDNVFGSYVEGLNFHYDISFFCCSSPLVMDSLLSVWVLMLQVVLAQKIAIMFLKYLLLIKAAKPF